ncbi:MAG: hypothetical protein SOT02_00340 [Elusimicrobiaceae bacterium]|uniref:hypothetical protein n=1 Tax=Candidatus Avelusimicrobium faecicola TaxID=3416205 RepID=UPI002A77344C|nr:hypothetical protein [Spirochaetota bacterium]MCI7536408.1 hypothetical protein [Spirochaetota bacterium]MDY2939395.1 hypothetical protein [Elusimicrobiaceae bacterium]
MENENFDLEQKPVSANKDLWLFLIVVDIVFLCVCGFFLYKNLSARFFMPVEETEVVAEEQAAAQPDLLAEVLPETKKETKKETKTPAAPAVKAPKVQEIAAEPVVVVPEPVAELAPKADEQEQPAEQAEKPAKASVVVADNPKSSKYRRVTFRYFGEGKKVSIVSGFTMAKPQALRKKNGAWETTLSIAPGKYRFLFIVDGVNTPDPYSPQENGRSVLIVD